MKIASGVYKLSFGMPETITPVSVLKPDIQYGAINQLPEFELPAAMQDIAFRERASGCLLEIPLDPKEDLYGLGLMLKSFRQTGLKKRLCANSDPASDTGDSHAPVPFYLSTAGYGVLVDTARYVSFHMGNHKVRGSKQDRENFTSAGTEIGHWWVKSGAGNLFVDIPAARGIDIYIFCGKDILDALARYNLFSGGGAMPPIWGLGVMYRTYMHGDKECIMNVAKELRNTKMPCDILGFEPGWQTHFYSCTYKWSDERFPEHKKMLDDLNSLGYKVNLWEHAYVNPDSPIFEEMKPYSADQYVWDRLVPDFSTAGAREVFGNYHAKLAEEGLSGFKLDECDSSDFTANWGFADFAQFPSGMDGEQMHMLFGALYQKTMVNIFEDRNRRTWGEVRNTTALSAPNPYVLYSDLYAHEDFVRGMASASCSGILWTPEVRQADSSEELLRRIAAATVSPQMVLNCYQVKTPPWTQWDEQKNLMGIRLDDAEELTNKTRKLLELRMRFIPVLYAAYYRYYNEGVPPIRPLVLDYPNDKTARPIYDEYLFGRELLAAPVIHGHGNLRRIWLPKGVWYDYFTNERLEGQQWIERETEPGDVPLFVKEGSLLAMAQPEQFVGQDTCFHLELTAYGEGDCRCTLISDDGVTNAYRDSVIKVEYTAHQGELTGNDDTGRYVVDEFRWVH